MKHVFNLFAVGGKIESFEIVTLHTSGMRHVTDYEIVMKGDNAEVSQYAVGYRDGEKVRQLKKRAVCDKATALDLLNRCGLLSWDGFNGKHPRGIKDGTTFRLEATVNGGKEICATGSQNFPRHFRDYTDGLYELLKGAEAVYQDDRYTLGQQNDLPYLIANGKRFLLTCHPYEPCLYITDEEGRKTVVHNAFDPVALLQCFRDGERVTSITGLAYEPEDFCRMVEYAAGLGDIGIDTAEKVFGNREKKMGPEKEPRRGEEGRITEDGRVSEVLSEYPDIVVEFCLVKNGHNATGYDAHRHALELACRKLFVDAKDEEAGWRYDGGDAEGKQVETAVLFAMAADKRGVNYRGAFCYPPQGGWLSDKDFDRVNGALFPNGTDELEVYEWTTDWSEYFDDGHEWWGALCYTVYDRSLDRFAVIMASATD